MLAHSITHKVHVVLRSEPTDRLSNVEQLCVRFSNLLSVENRVVGLRSEFTIAYRLLQDEFPVQGDAKVWCGLISMHQTSPFGVLGASRACYERSIHGRTSRPEL